MHQLIIEVADLCSHPSKWCHFPLCNSIVGEILWDLSPSLSFLNSLFAWRETTSLYLQMKLMQKSVCYFIQCTSTYSRPCSSSFSFSFFQVRLLPTETSDPTHGCAEQTDRQTARQTDRQTIYFESGNSTKANRAIIGAVARQCLARKLACK